MIGTPTVVRPPLSLRQRALTWLAQREHSRQELHDKLQRWVQALQVAHSLQPDIEKRDPPTEAQIPALLDALESAGHLSDARVVESRIHARAPKFGNLRIERELRHLGVGASEEARSALRASEAERARGVWARKFAQRPACAAERARQMRFLASRGFTADTIRDVLNSAPEDDVLATGD